MNEYDIALKSLITRLSGVFLELLTGLRISRWHNTELPEVRSRRADLLGETPDGRLVHIELQSTHDPQMALRMLEYSTAIYRGFGQFPEQVVLYVGEAPLRMDGRLAGPRLSYECRIADVRELDSEILLASGSLDDNVLAVLARMSDRIGAVRRILEKIATNDPARRAAALTELTILAGLRHLVNIIEKETDRMPILDDIMDHELIGRERRAGMALGREEGWEKGRQEGREEGREEGERKIIFKMITARFGPLPAKARQKLESMAEPELDALALRLLSATSLGELLD